MKYVCVGRMFDIETSFIQVLGPWSVVGMLHSKIMYGHGWMGIIPEVL